jgi:hypothetical protein
MSVKMLKLRGKFASSRLLGVDGQAIQNVIYSDVGFDSSLIADVSSSKLIISFQHL